jgi:hypothetical protein
MYRAEKVQKVGRAAMTRLSYLRINNSGSLAIFAAIRRAFIAHCYNAVTALTERFGQNVPA